MLYFYLILVIFVGVYGQGQQNYVDTEHGRILGKIEENYVAFKGIPYAEPPIDDQRFEPPTKYTKTHENFEAFTLHETCLRYDPMIKPSEGPKVIGSEDCLYLNVYVPQFDHNGNQTFPVMFYIHGGAFMFGSGDDLNEKILMKHQNMILVTFNYRLGPLGFLSTGDTEISGNMGLKDQRMALEWVNENIHAFHGDPKQVLLSGFSAGGASVEYHLLTKDIDNYVNAAISFSGSVLCPWAFVENPLKDAIKMANLMDCKSNDSKEIKNCLKKVDANEMVLAVKEFQSFYYNPIRVFGPVAESESVDKPFMTKKPESTEELTVPWISSYTAEDGGISVAGLFNPSEDGKNVLNEFNKDPKKWLSIILLYYENHTDKEINEYSEMLWKKYDLPEIFTQNDFDKLAAISTDLMLSDDIKASVKGRGKNSKTYNYVYDNPSANGFGNHISQNDQMNFKTHHGDDVLLILGYPERDMKKYPFRPDEIEHSNKFIKMLANFAITGVPVYDNKEFLPVYPGNNYLHIYQNSSEFKQMHFD